MATKKRRRLSKSTKIARLDDAIVKAIGKVAYNKSCWDDPKVRALIVKRDRLHDRAE
jgi:Ran GTPase-activating protein (RanGAP) involved in mRNA processing and transport